MPGGPARRRTWAACQWWTVEDEFGRDPAVRYKQIPLLEFPTQMLLKRVEERTEFTVPGLYEEMRIQLDEIRQKHFPREEGGTWIARSRHRRRTILGYTGRSARSF